MLFLTIAYILWKTVGKTLIEAIQAAWPAIKESLKFVGAMFMRVIDGDSGHISWLLSVKTVILKML